MAWMHPLSAPHPPTMVVGCPSTSAPFYPSASSVSSFFIHNFGGHMTSVCHGSNSLKCHPFLLSPQWQNTFWDSSIQIPQAGNLMESTYFFGPTPMSLSRLQNGLPGVVHPSLHQSAWPWESDAVHNVTPEPSPGLLQRLCPDRYSDGYLLH